MHSIRIVLFPRMFLHDVNKLIYEDLSKDATMRFRTNLYGKCHQSIIIEIAAYVAACVFNEGSLLY